MEQNNLVDPLNRPLQQLSWSQKTVNNHKWFKDSADYYISQSGTLNYLNESYTELDQLYGAYNSDMPGHWFTHITNPLSAKNPLHTKFPAKVRATNILRPNIDQLVAEYTRRPFIYQVVNRGEDGYNRYTTKLQEKLAQNMTEHFIALFQRDAIEKGIPIEEIPQPEEIEMPWEVQEKHKLSYQDALAVDGQRWLKRALDEYKIHRKRRRMFLDWMIGGMAVSYKNIEHGDLIYERKDPRQIDYDKSWDSEFIEDGEWVVCRDWYTISDIVDKFYEDLTKSDINDLTKKPFLFSADQFHSHLTTMYGSNGRGKIPVYHVQFKARKKMYLRMFIDPDGQLVEDTVDEDYIQQEGEELEEMWGNEVYEVWRIGQDMYVNPRAVPVQRNSMNNFSSCKLSYNGARFSPTSQGVFSVLKQGLPFQILYIITTYQLERTIAKNKGKILLLDKATIPNTKGWDEEKFFYYAESQGYALINRNQPGVDKGWNQYSVQDMSTFSDIKDLIELQNYFRTQWDLTLGFNEQRKGQTYASSQSGATSQAIFQSNLVTDLVFLGFEDFMETDLQGLVDLSKFLNVDGVKALYNGTLYDRELINIDPYSYCNADFGILLSRSPEEQEKVTVLKNMMQGLVQNGMSPSMLVEIIEAGNMAEIKAKLKKMEEIEQRQAQAAQEAEVAATEQADQRLAAIEAMKNELAIQLQDHKYRWEERLSVLEGQMEMNSAALLSKDEVVGDVPNVQDIFDRYIKTMELSQKERMQTRDLAQRERESQRKFAADKLKARTALKNKVSGEK